MSDNTTPTNDRRSGEERRSGDDRRAEEFGWVKSSDLIRNVLIIAGILVGFVAWFIRLEAKVENGSATDARQDAAIAHVQQQRESDRREQDAILREILEKVNRLVGQQEAQRGVR